jgi:hypothetical protein
MLNCTVEAPAVPVGRFCQIAQPLYWSKLDTPDTIAQAKRHNARGKRECGWK